MTDFWADADVISVYTRAEAIEDGTLVDVSEMASEAGFKIPVALTRTVWADCVEWDDANRGVQDETGRLWDVLWMASIGARRHRDDRRFTFQVLRVPNTPKATVPRLVELECVCGPGDTAAPVLTIQFHGED